MDFVNEPTGTADPGFARDPLITEEESRADMERAKEEDDEFMFGPPEPEEPEPVGDGVEGMGFLEFLEGEQQEQEDLPPLF